MSDIDTAVVVDGLKALDPKWPIREADMAGLAVGSTRSRMTHFGSGVSSSSVGSKPVGMVSTACVPARTFLTNCPGAILLLVDPIPL